MFQAQPLRHPYNDKLRLYYDEHYFNYDVQQRPEYGPLIENYLISTINEIEQATQHHSRVLAFRADLRFPDWTDNPDWWKDNRVLTRFFASFKYQIKKTSPAYRPFLRYVWAKEQAGANKPHYHLLIMLSGNVFDCLGNMRPDEFGVYGRENVFHRMTRSWFKALGFRGDDALGQLIHIGESPDTKKPWVSMLSQYDWIAINDAVYNASYLCKQYSKPFGQHMRVFDTSQG